MARHDLESGQALADHRPFMTYWVALECLDVSEVISCHGNGGSSDSPPNYRRLLAPIYGGITPKTSVIILILYLNNNVHQCSHIHTLHEGNVSMVTSERANARLAFITHCYACSSRQTMACRTWANQNGTSL